MKLLLFSDLHRRRDAAEKIVSASADADVLVGAGDFATVRQGIEDTISILQKIQKPTVLVPGNSETDEELRLACRKWPSAQVLHGSGVELQGIPFYGLGGAVPVTPFGDWSFDLTEEEATALLANCPTGCVLVSHSPPKGFVDISSDGMSLGSQAVYDTVLRTDPRLCVCGHIHESGGKMERLGETPVVNVGPEVWMWNLG